MAPPSDSRPPMAVALEWVSRITAVAFVMVLPGLAGYWIDTKIGTRFLAPVGFVVGILGGIWSLLAVTGAISAKKRPKSKTDLSSSKKKDQQT
jgi:hypothetical protein